MGVRIIEIRGSGKFFRPGDEILSIGGRKVEDQLDVLFLAEGEGASEFVVRRADGRMAKRRLRHETLGKSLPVFEQMRFISCRSRCIFCFVDQMPPGMRETLYKKDDDYRLSFLFGNYITLSAIGEREAQRIVEYNLSPLYVSVHATEKEARRVLFGREDRRDIMSVLRRFAEAGIAIHSQIVLVPGINDGEVLERTIKDLYGLYPSVRSVAVVPVGLTRHRAGLEKLRSLGRKEASELVDWAARKRTAFSAENGGDPFLYLSDEIYLLAGEPFPDALSYGDFDQLSNGVGMCRLFIDSVLERARRISARSGIRSRMGIVTGRSGARLLSGYIIPELKRILPGLDPDIIEVKNRLFGETVTVSGLLSGKDIINSVRRALRSGKVYDCIVLPPNCVNHEGILLDDLAPGDIETALGVPVALPDRHFLERKVTNRCRGGGKS